MKHILTFTLLAWLMAAPVWATVAEDAKTTYNGTSSDSTNSGTHTVTGSNTLMLACVAWRADVGAPTTVTAISQNGVSMLSNVVTSTFDSGNDHRVVLYYLVAPATGTFSLTMSHGAYRAVNVATFTGVNQVTPLGTPATYTQGSVTSATADVTVTADGIAFGCDDLAPNDPGTITGGGGQTLLSLTQDGSSILIWLRTSYEAGTGTVTISDSWVNAITPMLIAVPINPAAASTRRPIAPIIFQ